MVFIGKINSERICLAISLFKIKTPKSYETRTINQLKQTTLIGWNNHTCIYLSTRLTQQTNFKLRKPKHTINKYPIPEISSRISSKSQNKFKIWWTREKPKPDWNTDVNHFLRPMDEVDSVSQEGVRGWDPLKHQMNPLELEIYV